MQLISSEKRPTFREAVFFALFIRVIGKAELVREIHCIDNVCLFRKIVNPECEQVISIPVIAFHTKKHVHIKSILSIVRNFT